MSHPRIALCVTLVASLSATAANAETPADMLNAARSYRQSALNTAHTLLTRLRQQVAQGRPASEYDAATLRYLASWMFMPTPTPGNMDYVAKLDRLVEIVRDRREATFSVAPDPAAVNYCSAQKPAYAWTNGARIYLCPSWVSHRSAECRRVVFIHEHIHAIQGIKDNFGSNSGRGNPTNTEQAMQTPDYLAGFISQLHSGHSDRCDGR